jgi:hypothetical protein
LVFELKRHSIPSRALPHIQNQHGTSRRLPSRRWRISSRSSSSCHVSKSPTTPHHRGRLTRQCICQSYRRINERHNCSCGRTYCIQTKATWGEIHLGQGRAHGWTRVRRLEGIPEMGTGEAGEGQQMRRGTGRGGWSIHLPTV